MSAAAIEALIILAAKYGPQLVLDLVSLWRQPAPTLADIETLFKRVKPYEEYFPATGPVTKS
jgi:hypothetical protein